MIRKHARMLQLLLSCSKSNCFVRIVIICSVLSGPSPCSVIRIPLSAWTKSRKTSQSGVRGYGRVAGTLPSQPSRAASLSGSLSGSWQGSRQAQTQAGRMVHECAYNTALTTQREGEGLGWGVGANALPHRPGRIGSPSAFFF